MGLDGAVPVYKRQPILFNQLARVNRTIPSLTRKCQKLNVMLIKTIVFVNHVVDERLAIYAQ
jgi:hypothetical protein